MSAPLAITGFGAVTSLGHGAAASAAGARAGILRAAAIDGFMSFDETTGALADVAGHAVRRITEGFADLGRVARLGRFALEDLARTTRLPDRGRGALFVALADRFFEREALAAEVRDLAEAAEILEDWDTEERARRERHRASLPGRLGPAAGLSFDPALSEARFDGATGFAAAVESAAASMSSGKLDWAVVGGVDSLLDGDTLAALDQTGVLKGPENPVGIMPGEAASFLLLERAREAPPRAVLRATRVEGDGRTRFADDPSNGAALASAVRLCLGSGDAAPRGVAMVAPNLAGDSWRAGAWGTSLARLPVAVREARPFYPAASFGEIGAATGPVAACVAIRAVERGWVERSEVVVPLIGDDGSAACLALGFPESAGRG